MDGKKGNGEAANEEEETTEAREVLKRVVTFGTYVSTKRHVVSINTRASVFSGPFSIA